MAPLLSILVPTLACRAELFDRLNECLAPQLSDEVEVLMLRDNGQETTGLKRHRLIHAATGDWLSFADDDDLLSGRYCELVLAAIKGDPTPDVIGFRLKQFDDGIPVATAIHSVSCGAWRTEKRAGEMAVHYRTPNHLNPVRREMAIAVGYCDRNYQEDSDYAERLMKRYPSMRETFIDEDLYFYCRRKDRHGEKRNPYP